MAKQSIYGIINDCLNWFVVRLCLLESVLMWFGYVTFFIQTQGLGTQVNWLAIFYPGKLRRWGVYVGEAEAEDVLIWPLSPSRSYSVRSAYRMLMEAENSSLPSSSSSMTSNSIWKKIWKLKVPNKVCHFLQRMVKDSSYRAEPEASASPSR